MNPKTMEVEGKSAVVTGGGNGIGRALCLALAAKGANVAVADIELDAAEAVAAEVASSGVRSFARQVDVAVAEEVQALADAAWATLGGVEILVNNAGVMHATKPLWETTADDFDWCFAVNVRGVLNGIRAFVPRFVASDQPAWILNTGSEHSLGVPHLFGGLYTATKHALLGLSDVLRRELPGHVGVSLLCPGLVESTLWRAPERRQAAFGGAEAANEAGAAAIKLGMPAEEVARNAITAIEAGSFLAISHAHVIDYAEERWAEIRDACAAQAPRSPGDDQYKLDVVIQKLMSQDSSPSA